MPPRAHGPPAARGLGFATASARKAAWMRLAATPYALPAISAAVLLLLATVVYNL
jgi:hypothetical protein